MAYSLKHAFNWMKCDAAIDMLSDIADEIEADLSAQREGEAVAWMYPEGGIIVFTANKHIALQRMRHGIKVTPLYKEPPRPRVEVTEEMIFAARRAYAGREHIDEGDFQLNGMMRAALKAALSEKGHD
jgi:hypothetical protein